MEKMTFWLKVLKVNKLRLFNAKLNVKKKMLTLLHMGEQIQTSHVTASATHKAQNSVVKTKKLL